MRLYNSSTIGMSSCPTTSTFALAMGACLSSFPMHFTSEPVVRGGRGRRILVATAFERKATCPCRGRLLDSRPLAADGLTALRPWRDGRCDDGKQGSEEPAGIGQTC